MKAITTKYHGPTNARGSRISARDCDNNKVFVSYDHSLDSYENHLSAARALINKMQWKNVEVMGGYIKGGMAFVMYHPTKDRIDF